MAVASVRKQLVPAAAASYSAWHSYTQVVKNTVNVMAGNTAALAILSWVVSMHLLPLRC